MGAGNSFAKEEMIYIPTGLRKVIFSVKFGKKKGPKGPIIIRDIESNQKFSFEGNIEGAKECKSNHVKAPRPNRGRDTNINYFIGKCSFLNHFMNSFSKNYWHFLLDENLGKNKYLGVDPITNKKYEFSLPFSLGTEHIAELIFDGGADKHRYSWQKGPVKIKDGEGDEFYNTMKENWELYLKQYKDQQVLKKLNDLEDNLSQNPINYRIVLSLEFESSGVSKNIDYNYFILDKDHFKTKEWSNLKKLILKAVKYSKAFKDGGKHYEDLTDSYGVGEKTHLKSFNAHFLFPEENIGYARIHFLSSTGFKVTLVGNNDSELMIAIKNWVKEKAKK